MEIEELRRMGRPKNTCWDCDNEDMKSFGLQHEDARDKGQWIRVNGDRIKRRLDNPGLTEKWTLKWCVCVTTIIIIKGPLIPSLHQSLS